MVKLYSHSKLSVFEQCPLKYKFKYLDLIEPEIKQTIEGFLGSKVHETLEWLYKKILEGATLELDSLIAYYVKRWNDEYSNEIKTNGSSPENCFNQGVKFIIDYFRSNFPFLDNTIALEKKILVPLDEKGEYLIQGYIDRLAYDKDKNIFEIHDYKTGLFLKSQEELDRDRQLALYSIGIKKNFPEAKEIKLVWHFLAYNKKMISKRTDEELEKLKLEVLELINRIETTKEFYPNKSPLCEWCEFKSHCDKFLEGNSIRSSN